MARVELTPDEAAPTDPLPLTLAVGDDLVVRLPEPATAGYSWEIADAGGVLEPVEPVDEPGVTALVGGTTVRTFQFRPTTPGEGRLSLALRRPFEPTTAPVRRFDLALHVTDPTDRTIPPVDPR